MATLRKWAINGSTRKPKKKMQYNLAKTKSTMRKANKSCGSRPWGWHEELHLQKSILHTNYLCRQHRCRIDIANYLYERVCQVFHMVQRIPLPAVLIPTPESITSNIHWQIFSTETSCVRMVAVRTLQTPGNATALDVST